MHNYESCLDYDYESMNFVLRVLYVTYFVLCLLYYAMHFLYQFFLTSF